MAKVKLKRSQSVDILTLATVWPLYPVLSLSLTPLPRVYLQFIQAYPHNIITLSAVWHSRLTPSPSLTVLWLLGLLIIEVWQLTVVTLYLWPHCPFSALDLAYHVTPTHCMSSYTCAINLPIWIHSLNAKSCVICQIQTIWVCHKYISLNKR